MTDDLTDRLSEADLIEPRVVHDEGPEPEVYEGDGFTSVPLVDAPALQRVRLEFVFVGTEGKSNEEIISGDLRSISFGKGWLISMETTEDVMPIVIKAAGFPITHVRVLVAGVPYLMKGEIDCTATFVPGGASFTVTADEASYV